MFERELERQEELGLKEERKLAAERGRSPSDAASVLGPACPPAATARNQPVHCLGPPPWVVPRLPPLPPKTIRRVTLRRRLDGVCPIFNGRWNWWGTSPSPRTTNCFPKSRSRSPCEGRNCWESGRARGGGWPSPRSHRNRP